MEQTTTTARPDADAQLLVRLRAGEDAAFAELLERFGGRLLAVARRLLASEEDAQDALQEAMLSAFTRLEAFRGESGLGTWLHRIVVNTALMKLRSRSRRPEESLDSLLPQFRANGHPVDFPERWHERPESALERRETREFVRAAIQQLPDTYRTAVVLRDIEEFSLGEVADLLEITKNAAKVRVHRGRLALRTLLDDRMRGING